jgi:F-type H+-transporting ATPase subunit gamma
MSNATQDLRRKIASAGQLQSVVRTMKALAAAHINQYQNSVRALADYSRAVSLGLAACFRLDERAPEEPQPVAQAANRRLGAIVFGSDQGLVGRFNEIVTEYALAELATRGAEPLAWAVGERVRLNLAEAAIPAVRSFAVPNSVQEITPLVSELLEAIELELSKRTFEELHLFYNCTSVGEGYATKTLRLLPLDATWRRDLLRQHWPTKSLPQVLCSDAITLRALVREFLFISLFRACAESLASENASRLAAMERADHNIEEMLDTVRHSYHQLRQSDIDQELFDLVSGVESCNERRA